MHATQQGLIFTTRYKTCWWSKYIQSSLSYSFAKISENMPLYCYTEAQNVFNMGANGEWHTCISFLFFILGYYHVSYVSRQPEQCHILRIPQISLTVNQRSNLKTKVRFFVLVTCRRFSKKDLVNLKKVEICHLKNVDYCLWPSSMTLTFDLQNVTFSDLFKD